LRLKKNPPLRLKRTLLCVLCGKLFASFAVKKESSSAFKKTTLRFKKNPPLLPLRLKKNPPLRLKRTLLCGKLFASFAVKKESSSAFKKTTLCLKRILLCV
jgi:hypothetical protein